MAHARKAIRDNIKTTLSGLTTTGTNVYQSRVYPMAASRLPGILIYNKIEETEYRTVNSPRLQERVSTFNIEVYVKGTANFDDSLDQICLEIEEALSVDLTRGGNAEDTRITTFEADFNGDGDQPVAVALLTVEVRYQARENNPDVSI
nr:Phage minor tail protein U [uncultured Mediterranean phage uvMED]